MAADGHTFQITQAAALMCEHLSIPDGVDDFIATLHDWQDLTGAIIGALMGVVGALIVAARATRRERRIAASSVMPEVMMLQAANEGINRVVSVSYLTKLKSKRLVCDLLNKQRPVIRTLHSPVITQLYDVHPKLYSHLFQCHMIHEQLDPALDTYQSERNSAKAPLGSIENVVSSEDGLNVRAAAAAKVWEYCVEHATLANYFIDRFIFGRWPAWAYGLRMRLFPNDLDRRSTHLLKTGHLLSEAQEAKQPTLDPDKII